MVEPRTGEDALAHPLLSVTDLTKRYGYVTAADHVSFSIREGEILGLIGPNGSGKTTVFECIGGVAPLDEGAILRNGRPLTGAERNSILFYLPDAITPWPAQSIGWALDFMLGLFGGDGALSREVVDYFELSGLMHRRMGELSKGQRKRVLLAIGLLMPQPLFVADEPFEGFDLRQTREIAGALRSYAGPGKRTMLLSIHQISDAARVCDRFVLLSEGKVRGEGTLPELSELAASRGRAVKEPSLEEVFLALT